MGVSTELLTYYHTRFRGYLSGRVPSVSHKFVTQGYLRPEDGRSGGWGKDPWSGPNSLSVDRQLGWGRPVNYSLVLRTRTGYSSTIRPCVYPLPPVAVPLGSLALPDVPT